MTPQRTHHVSHRYFRLPLATFYAELSGLIEMRPCRQNDFRAPLATQDHFVLINRHMVSHKDKMIYFACENQGSWGAKCSFDHDDNKVYSDFGEVSLGEGSGFVPVCDSLTHFITTLALQEAVMSSPFLVCAKTDELSNALDISMPPLWLNGCLVCGPTHDFYYNPTYDLIAMVGDGIWLGSYDISFIDRIICDTW